MSRKDQDRLTIDSPEDLVREVNREIDAIKGMIQHHNASPQGDQIPFFLGGAMRGPGDYSREQSQLPGVVGWPKIPTVAEAVDAKEWRKVPEPSEFAKECAEFEDTPEDVDPLHRRLSSIDGLLNTSIGCYIRSLPRLRSARGLIDNHPQADPDVMGYLHSAFGVAPALAGQNYRITLGALDLDFCLDDITGEWLVYVDAITADDFVEGTRTLALAVQAAKISAREILTEDLERLQ